MAKVISPSTAAFGANIGEVMSAQQKKAAAIPTIQSTPAVSSSTGTREQKRMILSVAAGAAMPVLVSGDFYFVESIIVNTATGPSLTANYGTPLTIRTDTANVDIPLLGAGEFRRFPTPYNSVTISSATGNLSVQIVIVVGFGDYRSPIQRVAPTQLSIYGTGLTSNLGAYAVGYSVSSGLKTFGSIIPKGYNYAKVVRARLTLQNLVTTNADFLVYLFNGGWVPAPPTDNSPFEYFYGDAEYSQPPLRFNQFIAGTGLSNAMFCDLADFGSSCVSNTLLLGSSLSWQPVAMAAWNPAAAVNLRLDLTVEVG